MFLRKVIIPGALIILIMAGFVLGQAVNAAIGGPGGEADPLVTKSYLDSETAKLRTLVDGLKGEANSLNTRVDELKKGIDSLKTEVEGLKANKS